MTRLLLITALFVSCSGNAKQITPNDLGNNKSKTECVIPDNMLENIQSKIYSAFVQSMMAKENKSLVELSIKLEQLEEQNHQNVILYWRSYLQFYSSIYYLKLDDRKQAEKEIDKGIDWLDQMPKKNSEDYALLAMLQSFGIQFKGMKAMFISGDVKENAQQALAIDSTNLRALYVLGNNDFYTPEKYGGGTKAEDYLLKAISLPTQKVKNGYLPSWGKEEAYEMIVRLYIKKEKWDMAKKFYQEGIRAYPQSYTINQLASELVGK